METQESYRVFEPEEELDREMTPAQQQELARWLKWVKEHDYGEVRLVIINGALRRICPVASLELPDAPRTVY